MNINLSISPAPSITNKLATVVYAADAPSVIVQSYEFDPPHTSPRDITFPGLEPKTYIVNTYETTGLPTLGTLRHSFIYDASFIGAEIKPTEFLYMTGGADNYTDTNWIGWTVDKIERVGAGSQYTDGVGTTIALREDGFDLTVAGDTFGDQEKWVVSFYPKINTIDPIFRSAKIVRDSLIIDSDITLTDAHAGIALRLKGASSHFTITLPDTSTLENMLMFIFLSDGGSHVNVTIARTGTTDTFDWRGSKSYMVMAQNERLWLSNNNGSNEWLCTAPFAPNTGLIIDMYDKPVNAYDAPYTFADGLLLDRIIYKRLFDYFTALPSSAKVADATWVSDDTAKGKWTAGDGSTTFRVPRLYTAGFLSAVDGSVRLPGSNEASSVGSHIHPANDSDNTVLFVKRKPGGPGGGLGLNAVSGGFELAEQSTGANTGVKTVPNNTGIYKLILL